MRSDMRTLSSIDCMRATYVTEPSAPSCQCVQESMRTTAGDAAWADGAQAAASSTSSVASRTCMRLWNPRPESRLRR